MAAMNLLICLAISLFSVVQSAKIYPLDARALLSVKAAFTSYGSAKLSTWTAANDCSNWFGVKCSGTRVISVSLSNYGIKGRIAAQIGSVSNLQVLDLSNNNLNGVIPTTIVKLTKMQHLLLQYNSITGTLPAGFGSFPVLVSVRVDHNYLYGDIDRVFSSAKIYYVDYSANYFEGFTLIKKNLKKLCGPKNNASRGLNMAFNCLGFEARNQPCYNFQRPSGLCKGFCNAYNINGPCANLGTCTPSGSAFKCVCFPGHKLSKTNKFVCV